jgi:hypothetical protein
MNTFVNHAQNRIMELSSDGMAFENLWALTPRSYRGKGSVLVLLDSIRVHTGLLANNYSRLKTFLRVIGVAFRPFCR